jgi:hypothetical protein
VPQFMEPEAGTQGVQLRVHFEKNDGVGMVGIGFFKPVQGVVIFAKARVDKRDIERRDVLLLRLLQQLVQEISCFGCYSGDVISSRQAARTGGPFYDISTARRNSAMDWSYNATASRASAKLGVSGSLISNRDL